MAEIPARGGGYGADVQPETERRGLLYIRGALQHRRPSNSQSRVHWDEAIIAEHDKERGTRQKIDEPDTPFVRSPQTTSDSEVDEEHKPKQVSSVARARPLSAGMATAEVFTDLDDRRGTSSSPCSPSDVDPEALASRLDSWVRLGSNRQRSSPELNSESPDGNAADAEFSLLSSGCSSRSSSSARQKERSSRGCESRVRIANSSISFPEEPEHKAKPSSDRFKALRAKHYNEFAALQAFKRGDESDSHASDTSDEACEAQTDTKTNTNTNINRTSKAKPRPNRSLHDEGCSQASGSTCRVEDACELESSSRDPQDKAFSGESSEEFCRSRQRHCESIAKEAAPLPDEGCLETTHSNLHRERKGATTPVKDSTEARRPPVKFGEDSLEAAPAPAVADDDWRSKRKAHYTDMAAALRAMPPPSEDESDEGAEEDKPD